ncbi:MAG: hypothetical protein JNJ54_24365 [Myxococcaceae bacterium]|nr:hypothetical protein [Myxococcaceae bacterium]
MRISGRGVVAVAQTEAGDETVRARGVVRVAPVRSAHTVDRFEASGSDVPDSRAGTVRQTRHALVTSDDLGVAQGPTNACGPVALWLALGQFGRATQTWEQLDAELRPWGLGTSPGVLLDGARERGLQAQLYNHGTFFDLERETQAGRAVLVMTDVGGYDAPNGDMQPGSRGDFESHWMRVTRAWEDSTRRRWVEYENPWGTREVLRYEQFEALWRDQRLGGIPTGYDRAYILIDRAKAKPLPTTTADDVQAVLAVSDGAQTAARGVDALLRGKVLTGLGRLVGGVATTVLGAAGSVLSVPGEALTRAGDALLDVAERGLRAGGVAAVGGAVAGAVGMAVRGTGMIANAVGNALGFIGNALGAMVQGAFSALSKLFG